LTGLNFRFVREAGVSGLRIQNVMPLNGERGVYISKLDGQRSGLSYARIAALPNLAGKGRVMLIAGIDAVSSEGATDAVLAPELLGQAKGAAGMARFDAAKDFELLLEIRCVTGTVREWRLIAARCGK
jgi:hypothetical protein